MISAPLMQSCVLGGMGDQRSWPISTPNVKCGVRKIWLAHKSVCWPAKQMRPSGTSSMDVNQRFSENPSWEARCFLLTRPRSFPFCITAAQSSTVQAYLTGVPTMIIVSVPVLYESRSFTACSAPSSSTCWRNRSWQVYAVMESSGKQTTAARSSSACAMRFSICCKL